MSQKRAADASLPASKDSRMEPGAEPAVPEDRRILAQLRSEQGENLGGPLDLPHNITPEQLQLLCNKLLANVSGRLPHLFCSVYSPLLGR
jgi:hypothetical protein